MGNFVRLLGKFSKPFCMLHATVLEHQVSSMKSNSLFSLSQKIKADQICIRNVTSLMHYLRVFGPVRKEAGDAASFECDANFYDT